MCGKNEKKDHKKHGHRWPQGTIWWATQLLLSSFGAYWGAKEHQEKIACHAATAKKQLIGHSKHNSINNRNARNLADEREWGHRKTVSGWQQDKTRISQQENCSKKQKHQAKDWLLAVFLTNDCHATHNQNGEWRTIAQMLAKAKKANACSSSQQEHRQMS